MNRLFFLLTTIGGVAIQVCAGSPSPDGNAIIRAVAGPSEIVIRTSARFAGAIDSLTWNGMEFINSRDHGRELQFAVNLDDGTPITGETFNPTEAGSRDDHFSTNTSSRLLELHAATNHLQTTCRMAFWLAPGENSHGNLAKNKTVLSAHLLSKQVQIGYRNLPNVIACDVTWTLPSGEHHTHANVEALTGYMPPEFSDVWKFNPRTGTLESLTNRHSFVPEPVVCSLPGGTHAMGIYAPPQPRPHSEGPIYGYYRFFESKTVPDAQWRTMKWNCVFRLDDPKGLAPGEYSYQMFVIVGDLATVRDVMGKLFQMTTPRSPGGL